MSNAGQTHNCDVAIVGSGFGGSLLALVARRVGLTVALLERGSHPRFAIGESTSPLTNLLLEEIAKRYDLTHLLPLTTYGNWRKSYPRITCGLKRGFSFFAHAAGKEFRDSDLHERQLLVAASPNDEVSDTHWLRAEVDEFLMREAVDAGVDYVDRIALEPASWLNDRAQITGDRDGCRHYVRARLVVDATGPRGYLSKSLGQATQHLPGLPNTQALYTHFAGVRRCDSMREYEGAGAPPFPIDDAALHHVFDGGWMWVLRFRNGIASAGIAVSDALADELMLAEAEPAWHRFLARFPTIARQFENAVPIRPFVHAPKLPYKAEAAAGPGWAMLPSAVAFIDPLFSTGIPLTLLGIERLGRILSESWDTSELQSRLDDYGSVTLSEADITASYVGACRDAMSNFERFVSMAMYYFAAASFAEMAKRLDSPLRPSRFLASDHSEFGQALRSAAQTSTTQLANAGGRSAAEAIDCINVAGLSDPRKRNWYDVDLRDVVAASNKLGYSADVVRNMLKTADWAQPNDL